MFTPVRSSKTHKALIYGEYKLLLPLDPDLYVYTRTLEQDTVLVILNFFDDTPVMEWPKTLRGMSRDLLISNYDLPPDAEEDRIELRPYEARVYRLT